MVKKTINAIRNEIDALSEIETLRLYKIAGTFAAVNGFYSREDLLHDAIEKTLDGSRSCPQNVNVFTYLVNAMRSIASNQLEQRKRQPKTRPLEVGGDDHEIPDETTKSQEEEMINAEHETLFRAFLLKQCRGCKKTMGVLLGGFDRLRGMELCDSAGVSKSELATIHRRIARMMESYGKGDR